ncbi:MAG: TOBE domain-containing protein [Nocardioidaceae bacterium]|nr:MAG: TOBE domain-containing protein [Nocardioidaceae bacterium]
MEYLRIGEVAKACGVSIDTLRRWESEGRVVFERIGNQRVLPRERLSELLGANPAPPSPSSARNRLAGVVVGIKKDPVMSQVEMACGDYRVVALVSTESVDELGLEIGSPATAVIKATNVVVER